MKDICNASELLFSILYADDTSVHISGNDITYLVSSINAELELLSRWFKANKLSLNVQKTFYLVFHRAKTTAYKRWNCQVTRPANCCHLIPSNRFLDGFPVPSQFAAAKLTHYSTMPHRPSDSSRPRQRLLLSGDVHQNPGPATKYPCSVCTSNVTSRGVSYMCNRCSG